jgi:hypothetical protein
MIKEFRCKGLSVEESKKPSIEQFMNITPERIRRTLKGDLSYRKFFFVHTNV